MDKLSLIMNIHKVTVLHFWVSPGLTHKIYTRLERLARDKHYRLSGTFVKLRCSTFGQVLGSLTSIVLGWKGLPGTNTLTY